MTDALAGPGEEPRRRVGNPRARLTPVCASESRLDARGPIVVGIVGGCGPEGKTTLVSSAAILVVKAHSAVFLLGALQDARTQEKGVC